MLQALRWCASKIVTSPKKDDFIDRLAYLEGSVKYLAIDIYEGKRHSVDEAWQLLKEYGQVAAEQERRDQQKYGR